MPPRDWKFRVQDILEAIDKIHRYTQDMDYSEWQQDEKTVDAVIRNLEVIGEAASPMPVETKELHSNVPWKEMRCIRKVLLHKYFGVDLEVVWRTIQEDLLLVKERIEGIVQ